MKSIKNSVEVNGFVPTSATLSSGEKKMQRLTQQQLEAWWPFTRLNPSLFPKAPRSSQRADPLDDVEEAPI